ncbi:Synaptotagmin-5 [Vitis vinifera]|uniref:Synaptotagmin-5 n=1 Tax=Vitis vinifera TaxID=29760 RepID=A0A438FZA1_VITVI|nr:Synaptotagmin-5 [Vitis vinifera]
MSFFFGIVIGIACGIAVVVVFARLANLRSKSRCDLVLIQSSFSYPFHLAIKCDNCGCLRENDSARFQENSSSPVLPILGRLFSATELTWLNSHLRKIWPYVDEAASELIRSNVEPILEQYRPVILSALKFSKLTLGTVAPQFTGVSILEGEAGEVSMELEMQWDGNPNIVLDIKTRVGVGLPVQVKNIGFTGVFRLIFKPMVEDFPCFGAVCYSLREKKNLDFKLKVVGGDITALPGISDAIEPWVVIWAFRRSRLLGNNTRCYEDSITWPVRKIVPIIPGDYRSSRSSLNWAELKTRVFRPEFFGPILALDILCDLELKPVGTLEVKLVQARDLTNKDLIGKSDPYAVLFVRPIRVQASELIGCAQVRLKDLEPGKVKDVWLKLVKDLDVQRDKKYRGEVVNNSLNPIWNQTFDFVVEDGLHDMLILDVWDHDTFGKDKIGRCIFTLTRVILEGEFRDNFPLEGAKSGSLNLHLKWSPQPIFRDT